ncbi:MAG: hypothetical protein WEB93_01185, partial [Sphingomonadales bacterium]
TGAPVVAVSPIIGGTAVKGPTAKIMAELGHDQTTLTIARHYQGLIDGLVIDTADAALAPDIEALGIHTQVTGTWMRTDADRNRLATETLDFARALRPSYRTTNGERT